MAAISMAGSIVNAAVAMRAETRERDHGSAPRFMIKHGRSSI